MGLTRAQQHKSKIDVRSAHMRIFNTLVEAMCDLCLSYAWRKRCYRYIKRLLPLLYEMYDEHQYTEKVNEVNALYRYFLCGEHQPLQSTPKMKNQIPTPNVKMTFSSTIRPQPK